MAAAIFAAVLMAWPAVLVLAEHIPGVVSTNRTAPTLPVIAPWQYVRTHYAEYGRAHAAATAQNLAEWLRGWWYRAAQTDPTAPRPQQADLARFHRAEQSLTGYVNGVGGSRGMPGLSAAIYRDGLPLFQSEAGIRRDTRRPIASVTKTFTAVAILKLIERHRLRSLDTPIKLYLPDLALANNPAGGVPVTIRHLLQQNSGIPYGSSRAGQTVTSPTRKFSYYIPPQYRPAGESFAYSNHNYYVLALLIETVTGKTYAEYLQSAIFDPAGMQNTRVSPVAAGASGIATTVVDLSRFAAALYDRTNPIRLLKQQSVAEMRRVPDYIERHPDMMFYGLGVRVQYYGGEVAEIYHTGIWTNVFAELRHFPKRRASLVHLGNPPNFRAAAVNSYRAASVRMAADYLRLLDDVMDGARSQDLAATATVE